MTHNLHPTLTEAAKFRLMRVDAHHRDCDFFVDQYWWECTCGALDHELVRADQEAQS